MLGVLITIFQIIFLVAIFCFLVSILVAIILLIYKNYKGVKKMDIKNNTGDCNTGGWNTGDCNTGDYNTGGWNTGDWNTGYFNTITPDTILVFNKECKREEWNNAKKPTFIYFDLNVWIDGENMTEEEKQKHPEYKTTGGYLKEYGYKEAFQNSFNKLNAEEKKRQIELLKALPNFDKDVFFEISGIDIDKTE